MAIDELLNLLAEALDEHDAEHADWIRQVIACLEADPHSAYAMLNSKRMWGGAGSIANAALADNPGLDNRSWTAHIRHFRQLMIELAEALKSRGDAHPDIDFWLTAFINWNRSEV